MNNYILLEKHRKKLSIYFAFFILFSIWIVVWFFEFSRYFSEISKDKNNLKNKVAQISNIIKNKELYNEAEDLTLKKVINRVFENSALTSSWITIISKIDDFENIYIPKEKSFIDLWWYKYYSENIFFDRNYNILVRKQINLTTKDLLSEYLWLMLFSLPFSVVFYFLWYVFVWKNLKPIKETIRNMQDFTWNINHEFKTPIAEIISSLWLSLETWDFKKWVKNSIKSAKKLNNILDSLVGLINITDSSYKIQRVNLVSLSQRLIKNYKSEIEKKNIDLEFSFSSSIIIKKVIKDHFSICFWNILWNAIKYSDELWKVIIKIDKNKLEIKDYWKWIDRNNKKKIFERYFREWYIEDWSWVWLSIVKKICDVNNRKIKVKSKKWVWTKFTILFK